MHKFVKGDEGKTFFCIPEGNACSRGRPKYEQVFKVKVVKVARKNITLTHTHGYDMKAQLNCSGRYYDSGFNSGLIPFESLDDIIESVQVEEFMKLFRNSFSVYNSVELTGKQCREIAAIIGIEIPEVELNIGV